ncbi:MAG: TIR domain-containing protein [Rubrivivax sp.]|nr:TIR domain-containing protein [Rubrivivax sp.]
MKPDIATPAPVTLFYSYAHEDEPLRGELQDHLAILERRGVIRSWHDRAIVPGQDWSHEIDEHLRQADLVLLLISKDFIASDYIMGVELGLAMQRQQQGAATVVPILLRPVDLQPEDAQDMPFVDLLKPQGLPRDLKPVTTWANRDEAWTNVASGLRATVNSIRARRPQLPTPMPMPTPARSQAPRVAPAATPASVPLSAPRAAAPELAAPHEAAVERTIARVVGDVVQRIEQATAARGGPAPDAGALRAQAQRLIDTPRPPRVLWVDDHPANNRAETDTLARLQIEVEPVRSTDEALAALAAAAAQARPFDLVISDWTRQADGPLAGLRVLTAMRAAGHGQPVVYYHGSFDGLRRAALATAARAAGALGEATMPQELLALVLQALAR